MNVVIQKKFHLLKIFVEDEFLFLLYDTKVSNETINIECEIEVQSDGKILFYFDNDAVLRELCLFFEKNTDYELNSEENGKYYCINLQKVFSKFIKHTYYINREETLSNDIYKGEFLSQKNESEKMQNVIIDDISEKNIFEAQQIFADDPRLLSIAFDKNDWKEKKARKLLESCGFRTHCNIEMERKGVQRNGRFLIWYQNDPINHKNGLLPPNKTDIITITVENKPIYVRFADLLSEKEIQEAKHKILKARSKKKVAKKPNRKGGKNGKKEN